MPLAELREDKWGYRSLTKLLNAVGCFDIQKDYTGQMRTRRKTKSEPMSLPKLTPMAMRMVSLML